MAKLVASVALFCLCFIVVVKTQQSFCTPPSYFTSAFYDEVDNYNSGESWRRLFGLANYSFDVDSQAVRLDFQPFDSYSFTILTLYSQGLEIEWYDGQCIVVEFEPETLTNCLNFPVNPIQIYLGGSLAVLEFIYEEDDSSYNAVFTKGSYTLVSERSHVVSPTETITTSTHYFNFDSNTDFDGDTFTPPSYCQTNPQLRSSVRNMNPILHHPLNLGSKLFK